MMKQVAKIVGALSIALFACSLTVLAQVGANQQRLATASRLDCRFSAAATGDWDATGGVSSAGPAEFEASFFDIDVDGGSAEADSRFGSSLIVVRYSGDYLHLMQIIDTGPLYVTTVFAVESDAGRLIAVHTRHEYLASRYPEFAERPEMYVGDCAVES